MLGLPFTEDHALAESLRIKRPRQECFNCLATNHKFQDCPIEKVEERINLHRSYFTSQSMQAQEQANLYSNRYTQDQEAKENRGMMPGKISDQLKEALGLAPNMLPPYIYIMRELGYPVGWLIEAEVKSSKLAVHEGDNLGGQSFLGDEKNQVENTEQKQNEETIVKKESKRKNFAAWFKSILMLEKILLIQKN